MASTSSTCPDPAPPPPAGDSAPYRPAELKLRRDGWTAFEAMATEARPGFPDRLAHLADRDVEMVDLDRRDLFAEAPGDQDEDG